MCYAGQDRPSLSKLRRGQLNTAIATKRWKSLLASLILSGAGQFLSDARRRGIIWFGIAGERMGKRKAISKVGSSWPLHEEESIRNIQ